MAIQYISHTAHVAEQINETNTVHRGNNSHNEGRVIENVLKFNQKVEESFINTYVRFIVCPA